MRIMSDLRRRLGALLLTVALVTAGAVGARAESVFGLSFFGPDVSTYDARIEGRGGMGIAYRDSLNASVMLATQLADLNRVTVGISSVMESHTAEQGALDDLAGGTVRRVGLMTPTVRLGLPLGERGGIGLGYQAQRATQWSLDQPYATDDTVTEHIEREGTAFVVPLQIGYRVHPNVVLGAGMLLEKSTTRIRYDLELSGQNDISPSEVREDISSAIAFELSAAVQEIGPLSVAGYYVPAHDADVDERQRGVALTNRADTERTDTLPARWGLGARVDLPGRWSAGIDVESQLWSEYEGRSFAYTDGRFDREGTVVSLQDETEVRWGLERESVPEGLRQTTPWRVGAYWRKWHYQLEGSDLTEWGVTVGTGLSLRAGLSRVDLALGYSRIGNLDENGVSEDLWRLAFSIAGGERWY